MARRDDNAVRVEIAAPHEGPRKNPEQLLNEIVERKVGEILFKKEAFAFEPFFRSKKISNEIRRLQTVPEWGKWAKRFELYGCLDCKSKDGRHRGCGMCDRCYNRTREQLQSIVRRHQGRYEEGQYERTIRDDESLARDALFGEMKALPPAKKPRIYRTRAAAAAAAGIDPKTLSDWLRSGAVERPPGGWLEEDIEELRLRKFRNLSIHNSKASLARWSKKNGNKPSTNS